MISRPKFFAGIDWLFAGASDLNKQYYVHVAGASANFFLFVSVMFLGSALNILTHMAPQFFKQFLVSFGTTIYFYFLLSHTLWEFIGIILCRYKCPPVGLYARVVCLLFTPVITGFRCKINIDLRDGRPHTRRGQTNYRSVGNALANM